MSNANDYEKIVELLKEFNTAMLVTHSRAGELHARPMQVAEATRDGTVTFLTAIDSNKAWEVRTDERVALTFQSGSAYLSLTGRARVRQDRELLDKLWSKVTDAWFDGPHDPAAGVLSVSVETAEYWDNRGRNKLRFAFEMAKAMWSDESPDATDDQHGVASPARPATESTFHA